MKVDFQRKDYTDALPEWELVDDVCKGERQVKSRDRGRVLPTGAVRPTALHKRYLPMPNPQDLSDANLLRYEQYLSRAVFYNATGRTLVGLLGTAFKRPPAMEIGALDYLLDDADGNGVGLLQQVQAATGGVLKKGRYALWVDYPETSSGASRADMAAGRVRANIIGVRPEQVINWRTEKVGGQHRLALVVIHETTEVVADDGFEVSEVDQFRVLRLGAVEQGAPATYQVEVYRKNSDGKMERVAAYSPRKGNGQAWDVIPFTFIGSQDNNPNIDKAPLLDMATLNLAHYRNSADYEDSCFFAGQPQPWMAGLDEAWRDWLEEKGIYVGSRSILPLPEGAAFGFAQADPNTLVKGAMDQKEQQMVALGARLVTPGEAVKTATEAQSDAEAEHSVLSLVVQNVSAAVESVLRWAAEYMNITGEIYFELSRDFMEHEIDAQRLQAMVAAWQAGALPMSDLLASFQRAGLIDGERSEDEIREELEQSTPGLDLDAEPDAVAAPG